MRSYFNHFEGHQDCGITSKNLYIPPTIQGDMKSQHPPFCTNRAALLDAMSGGGREGFDASFAPRGNIVKRSLSQAYMSTTPWLLTLLKLSVSPNAAVIHSN